jgi:histidine ammonia-lyase
MLIRANTLARGYSGIRLETLELLLAMLDRGVHPIIPQKGSLGASGDLAPLAHMALPMIGEGKPFLTACNPMGQARSVVLDYNRLRLRLKSWRSPTEHRLCVRWVCWKPIARSD